MVDDSLQLSASFQEATKVERYYFYFTIPNMEKSVMYSFHKSVSIQYFIKFMTKEMAYISPGRKIEIFEVTEGSIKHKLNYPETSTLKEVFEDKFDKISFDIQFILKNNLC
jgi:hypothetical protein